MAESPPGAGTTRAASPPPAPAACSALAPSAAPSDARASRFSRAVPVVCRVYAVLLAVAWLAVRSLSDRDWRATLILFGPRWVWAAPLALLVPLALAARPRPWRWLGVSILLTLLAMGFCVPWQAVATLSTGGPTVRVLTCNTHWQHLDAPALARLIAETRPDVVALQEWSPVNGPVLFPDSSDQPWHVVVGGELCLASRLPCREIDAMGGWNNWLGVGSGARYDIDTPAGTIPFYNVHLASPHIPFRIALQGDPAGPEAVQGNSDTRLRQARDLARRCAEAGPTVLAAGDFNSPCDGSVYRATLTHLTDAFSAGGLGFGYTYDVRWTMTRIDHVLSGNAWRCVRCRVGPDVGSPHRPLIADFRRAGGPT